MLIKNHSGKTKTIKYFDKMVSFFRNGTPPFIGCKIAYDNVIVLSLFITFDLILLELNK